jgi:DNA-binding MarR family transcriptional regulator
VQHERKTLDDAIRPHTRRNGERHYLTERIRAEERRALKREVQPTAVHVLRAAGATGAALRRRLRALGIDPKMARLVLVLEGWHALQASDIAWKMNVSKTTASRHLDRAERAGLIDKLYRDIDRRGTWARLTGRGREFRARVVDVLETLDTERPAGVSYGVRAYQASLRSR